MFLYAFLFVLVDYRFHTCEDLFRGLRKGREGKQESGE